MTNELKNTITIFLASSAFSGEQLTVLSAGAQADWG
jgi:hypothetical protein